MKRQLPTTPQPYPNGICVHTERGYFYIRQQKRYQLPTRRILESWAFPRIIETTEAALKNYRVVAKLGFRDGSLIYNIADGKMYLISDNKKRQITSPDALDLLGIKRRDAVTVSNYEVSLQEAGEEINWH